MDQSDAPQGQDDPTEETNQEADSENEFQSMESLLEESDLSLDLPKSGEVRIGIIASVSESEILVSIGAKSEGVIPAKELERIPEEEKENFIVGAEIPVYVLKPDSRQGTSLLSYNRALEEDDWDNAEELKRSNEVYEGEIDGYNKGGLIVTMGRLRAFVPASQVGISRRMSYKGDTPEQRWSGMVGEPIIARIIEVDRDRRRLILSEKAASQESRESMKDRLLEELEVGQERTGRVTSLAPFGAFVNINGADGLVHLSEISWERINDPSQVLEVGQEVQVKVISIDKERKRIGLSLRQLLDDPWNEKVAQFKEGQLVEATITRLKAFGAFARLTNDIEGLIHVSEISDRRIEHPKEELNEGDTLTLRIIKVDEKRRRIGLSLKKVDSGEYTDMDWALTLAEIDKLAEPSEESDEESLEALDMPEVEDAAEEADETSTEDVEEQETAEDADETSEEEAVEEDNPEDEPEAEPETPAEDEPEAEPEASDEEPAEDAPDEPDEDSAAEEPEEPPEEPEEKEQE